MSDAVCTRIYKIGLETNTYSDRFFANYQLHFIPTSLAIRALFFVFLDAKLIVFRYSTIHTIPIPRYAPSVWLCFSSLLEVCFLQDTQEIVTRQFLSLHFRVTPFALFLTVLVS